MISTASFHHFPFLRDHLFVSFFKKSSPNLIDFDSFILTSQLDYYLKFINNNYSPTMDSKSISKCPFASKTTTNPCSFVVETLSSLRYTLLQDVHISDMNLSGLTVQLIRPGSEMALDAEIKLFLSGQHTKIANISVLCSDTRYCFDYESSFDNGRFSPGLTKAIITAKSNALTASDVNYLFPSAILIIKPDHIDRFLNLVVYLKISGIPLTLDNLRMAMNGIISSEPSSIEPYEDVLSIEYLQNNPNIFK